MIGVATVRVTKAALTCHACGAHVVVDLGEVRAVGESWLAGHRLPGVAVCLSIGRHERWVGLPNLVDQ